MNAVNDKILEARAYKMRSDCGFDSDIAIDFEKLLQELGVVAFFNNKLSKDFSGMAIKLDNKRFMMVNTMQQLARQHFTIGHELYHLCVQENFTKQICKTGLFDKKDKEEYNADVFSSFLLMPESGIMQMIPEEELSWGNRLSLTTVLKLEQYYGVSRIAMLIRLDKLGLLKAGDFEQYRSEVKKSAKENGYNLDLYEVTNKSFVIGDYGLKAKKLFDNEAISESHYHSLMYEIGIDIDKTEEDEQEGRA